MTYGPLPRISGVDAYAGSSAPERLIPSTLRSVPASLNAIYRAADWLLEIAPEEPHTLVMDGAALWRADGR